MGSIVSQVVAGFILLILIFLVVTNYNGMVAIMKQGGTSLSEVTYTLQGRGKGK